MDEGYILLHRKIINWEWLSDPNTLVVFIHCLLKANWKDGRFQGRDIKRGEFVTSLSKLAEETSLSVQNVRTALKHLESTGELTSKSHAKYRIISISNYDRYQCPNNQLTGNQQATNKQLTTIEERNKEINIIDSSLHSESIRPTETVRQGNPDDMQKVVDAWNTLVPLGIAGISKMSSTSTRYKNLNARIKEFGIGEVLTAIEKVKASDFLTGKKTDWRITFDWFVKPNNFPKVLDGNYNNNGKGDSGTPTWFTDDSG